MDYAVVCVHDLALDAFMRPFFAPNIAVAKRSFSDEVNRVGSEMHAHPEDYEMVVLGMWSDGDAVFNIEKLRVICRALDVYKEKV